MSTQTLYVKLAIQQIDFKCLFDLTWGDGQKLSAVIPFPLSLESQYKTWLNAYLSFYQSLPLAQGSEGLRGWVDRQGNLAYRPLDWQAELVQGEVDFLYHFHRWLRHQDLFEIRSMIAQLARSQESESSGASVDIFVSAEPSLMARLPWEQWELGAEFGTNVPLRIARCPSQLKEPVMAQVAQPVQRRQFRVLAILGDEQGLNFEGDREAIEAMSPSANIQFVGWQPQSNPLTLKQEICDAIASPEGWDLLFFAGHSNEKSLTGGEFIISPTKVLSLEQLLPALKTAKDNGLQLSIFNSCSGMGIATRLLEMGLSQVVVMREPIHNQVAHAFLQRFLFHLSEQKDAQDALHATCQDLKLSQNVTYPSAYCLPSLFRHPATPPFQFKPRRAGDRLKRFKPSRWEAIALGGLLLLSLLPVVQGHLLDSRLLVQALFRSVTQQLPSSETRPPIFLVQIDKSSYQEAQNQRFSTFSLGYLARIIQRLKDSEAKIIGVDYLLSDIEKTQKAASLLLNQTIQSSVQENQAWFIFSSRTVPGTVDQSVHRDIAQPTWSLWGDDTVFPGHLSLPDSLQNCQQRCPMGYIMALLARANQQKPKLLSEKLSLTEFLSEQPSLANEIDVQAELLDAIAKANQTNKPTDLRLLSQTHRSGITRFSQFFRQQWFTPVIDFSIPKSLVFQSVTAKDFLAQSSKESLSDRIVLIGSGGYAEAEDNFAQPRAQKFWWHKPNINPEDATSWRGDRRHLSGVELHGFMIHHLWTRRLVIPVPDVLSILLVAFASKLLIQRSRSAIDRGERRRWLFIYVIGIIAYAAFCLQMFLSVAILFPWLFPSITIGMYCIPTLLGNKNVHPS